MRGAVDPTPLTFMRFSYQRFHGQKVSDRRHPRNLCASGILGRRLRENGRDSRDGNPEAFGVRGVVEGLFRKAAALCVRVRLCRLSSRFEVERVWPDGASASAGNGSAGWLRKASLLETHPAHSAFGRRTQVVVAVQATSVTVVTVF